MFPRKEGGIQVLAGLAPFSQTVGPKQYFLRFLRMSPISQRITLKQGKSKQWSTVACIYVRYFYHFFSPVASGGIGTLDIRIVNEVFYHYQPVVCTSTIIMNDACTLNVSQPKLASSITIVNIMPQFGASLTDNSTVIIFNCNVLIIEATSSHRDRTRASALCFFILFFCTFEHVKSLLIMDPNNIKNSSLKCDFHIINYE